MSSLHLITHRGFKVEELTKGKTEHFWEFTAQCATYAYLKKHGEDKSLTAFEKLSPHQPFIYQTWEGPKVLDCFDNEMQNVRPMVRVFKFLPQRDEPPERGDSQEMTNY
jgi:hypothetical protein